MGNQSTFLNTVFNNRKMKSLYKHIKRNIWYYIFLVPGLTYFIVFHYLPMYGVKIAFQDYNVANGFGDSPWVGLKHWYRPRKVQKKRPCNVREFGRVMS